MSDAAGFERTMWLGKEPVLIALVAASAGFASLSAADLFASAEGARQLGSLQSALPVPAFGAIPVEVPAPAEVPAPVEVPRTDSEQASHAAIAPTVQATPVDVPIAKAAPVQAAHVESAPPPAPAAPAVAAAAAAAADLLLPAPASKSVDAAVAEFRAPAMPAAKLALTDPAPLTQAVAAPDTPAPEIAAAQAPVAPEAAAATANNLPDPGTPDLASKPPAFDGPPLVLASLAAEATALPASVQPAPTLAPLDIEPAALAAFAAGPDDAPAPPAAAPAVPLSEAEVLAANEPSAPTSPTATPSSAAPSASAGAGALDAAALAEWSRSVRQVGGWSLAQASDAPAAGPAGPAPQAGKAPSPGFRDAPVAARKHRLTGRGIEFALPVVIEGRDPAWVPLLIDAEQNVSVRIGDLLALIEPMLPPGTFARLSASQGAQEFVSLRGLRAQGIDFRYDAARNRLVLGDIASTSDAPRMAMLRDQ